MLIKFLLTKIDKSGLSHLTHDELMINFRLDRNVAAAPEQQTSCSQWYFDNSSTYLS